LSAGAAELGGGTLRAALEGGTGLGGAACNALHDTIVEFRPAYERRLMSLPFAPAFDLDAELADARRLTGRDDAAAHLENPS